MKSLIILYLVAETFFISPSFAQEPRLPPHVEQEINQVLDLMELFLRVIERIERLQEELEKPLSPSKPLTRELPGREI